MEIRTFRQEDAGPIVDLWNLCLSDNRPDDAWYVDEMALSESRLARTTSDPNFDPKGAFVACEEGQVVGFSLAVVKRVPSYGEEDLELLPGYLEGLVVHPSCRNRGIGGQLLECGMAYVQEGGKSSIRISRYRSAISGISVLAHAPAASFLLERGFQSEQHEMKLRLLFQDFCLRDEVVSARDGLARYGIEIATYTDRYRASFSRLMASRFAGWWHGHYRKNLDADRPLPVLLATEGDRVVGFIGFVAVNENGRAGFSPGVDPAYRRRGIGKVLVNSWADAVKQMGATESIISTGMENEPAKRIYFDMGYRKIGEFLATLTRGLRVGS